jgi:hypothetical protein
VKSGKEHITLADVSTFSKGSKPLNAKSTCANCAM